jgi:hypothetical protein
MEPRPWAEDGATDIEKALLRAGRADGPREGADLRLSATLQASPPSTFKPVTLPRWAKVGLIAVVAGGAAVVAHRLSRSHDVPPSARALVPQTPGEDHAPALPAEPPRGNESASVGPEPSPSTAGNAQGRDPRSSSKAAREVPAKSGAPSLGDETRALDRVREALDDHQPTLALKRLDDYRRKFPQGRLRPEATILRLSALLAADRRRAAESLASQLLSDAAYQPYVPRIQSLLREAKP